MKEVLTCALLSSIIIESLQNASDDPDAAACFLCLALQLTVSLSDGESTPEGFVVANFVPGCFDAKKDVVVSVSRATIQANLQKLIDSGRSHSLRLTLAHRASAGGKRKLRTCAKTSGGSTLLGSTGDGIVLAGESARGLFR